MQTDVDCNVFMYSLPSSNGAVSNTPLTGRPNKSQESTTLRQDAENLLGNLQFSNTSIDDSYPPKKDAVPSTLKPNSFEQLCNNNTLLDNVEKDDDSYEEEDSDNEHKEDEIMFTQIDEDFVMEQLLFSEEKKRKRSNEYDSNRESLAEKDDDKIDDSVANETDQMMIREMKNKNMYSTTEDSQQSSAPILAMSQTQSPHIFAIPHLSSASESLTNYMHYDSPHSSLTSSMNAPVLAMSQTQEQEHYWPPIQSHSSKPLPVFSSTSGTFHIPSTSPRGNTAKFDDIIENNESRVNDNAELEYDDEEEDGPLLVMSPPTQLEAPSMTLVRGSLSIGGDDDIREIAVDEDLTQASNSALRRATNSYLHRASSRTTTETMLSHGTSSVNNESNHDKIDAVTHADKSSSGWDVIERSHERVVACDEPSISQHNDAGNDKHIQQPEAEPSPIANTQIAVDSLMNMSTNALIPIRTTKVDWSTLSSPAKMNMIDNSPVESNRKPLFQRYKRKSLVRSIITSPSQSNLPKSPIKDAFAFECSERSEEKAAVSVDGKVVSSSPQEHDKADNLPEEDKEVWKSPPKVSDVTFDGAAIEETPRVDKHDIPLNFTMSLLSSLSFSAVWKLLEEVGWSWSKGQKLISYYWKRPQVDVRSSKEGVNYFISEEDVMSYIRSILQKRPTFSHVNTVDATTVNTVTGDESSSESLHDVTEKKRKRKSISSVSAVDCERNPILNQPWYFLVNYDINNLLDCQYRPELWAELQVVGWTWDYGSGLDPTYYIIPGVKKSTGKLGSTMFTNERDVRMYLIMQNGNVIIPMNDDEKIESKKRKRNSSRYTSADEANTKASKKSSNSSKSAKRNSKGKPCREQPMSEDSSDDDGSSAEISSRKQSIPTNLNRIKSSYRMSLGVEAETQSQYPRNPASFTTAQACLVKTRNSPSKASALLEMSSSRKHLKTPKRVTEGLAVSTVITNQRTRSADVPSDLFSNMYFVVTGLSNDHKMAIVQLLGNNAGKVLDEIPDDSKNVKKLIIIGNASGCRRPSYMMAVALGYDILHSAWVVRCIKKKSIIPFEQYVLPTGSSPLLPFFVAKNIAPASSVFRGLRFTNLAGSIWDGILTKTDAHLIKNSSQVISSISSEASATNGKIKCLRPDYLLIDSLQYIDGLSDTKNCRLIQKCLDESVPVVTTDWINHCIQFGEVVDPYIHSAFHYNDDFKKPSGFRCGEEGFKERYVIRDIVYFKSSPSANRSVGRIIEFVRRSIGGPMQVKIEPLIVSESAERREVALSNGANILIPADYLQGRPVVMSSSQYKCALYAPGDISILACDSSWEEKEMAVADAYCNRSRDNVCFSQDY